MESESLGSLCGVQYRIGQPSQSRISLLIPVSRQVEFKHFAAPDTVLSPKMHGQVIKRQMAKRFACLIPPKRDWALECFVHKRLPKGIRYYSL
jgi:hypothetical protein